MGRTLMSAKGGKLPLSIYDDDQGPSQEGHDAQSGSEGGKPSRCAPKSVFN